VFAAVSECFGQLVGQRRDSSAKLIDVIGNVLLHGANLDIPRGTSRWLSGGLQGKERTSTGSTASAKLPLPRLAVIAPES
jgi:hypothetical protein